MIILWLEIINFMFKKKGFTSKTWRLLYYKDILADGFFQYNFAANDFDWNVSNILNQLPIQYLYYWSIAYAFIWFYLSLLRQGIRSLGHGQQ